MLVLRSGRVLDPARGFDEEADVVIDDGRVVRVGRDAGAKLSGEGVRVMDVRGRWVIPGAIDLHVHLREPGELHKETIATGLRAALAGGFTTVCAMPNTQPVNDSRAITALMMARAKEAGGARLFPIGAVTRGSRGEELAEMAEMRDEGAIGVSDDGRCVMNAAVMRRALEYARTFDLLVSQHAEDHHMTEGALMHEGVISTRLGLRGWPREAEDIIVARDLILAELTGARYHVAHVSSLGAVRLLREAKARGLKVSAEVTPHHLTLTDEALLGYDTACKVNPPLRSAEDREALRGALADGTLDCIATDHAPHALVDKDKELAEASNGMIGLETALPVTLELVRAGVLSPSKWVDRISAGPARILGVEGGTLREGARADVAVIDPEARWTVSAGALRSKSRNSPWLNREVIGRVSATIVRGELMYES